MGGEMGAGMRHWHKDKAMRHWHKDKGILTQRFRRKRLLVKAIIPARNVR